MFVTCEIFFSLFDTFRFNVSALKKKSNKNKLSRNIHYKVFNTLNLYTFMLQV